MDISDQKKIEVPICGVPELLDETTGYVAMIDLITVDQFKAAIDDLTAEGMNRVIDLRNNPGGILDSAVAMVDYLIPG